MCVLTAFFAIKILAAVRSYNMLGGTEAHTITLSGHGEVNAVPDIASVYFTVESSKTTQSASSEEVNKKIDSVLALLKSSGIEDKDVKTEGYNSYPKYSSNPCPIYYQKGIMPPCNPNEAKITGYTVSQSVSVKIRKVDDASVIIDGINKIGVSNMSGPNFTIDDPDNLQAQARKEAIDDARTKAEALAKDLGVRLGKVASYSEGGYGGPMYYAKDMVMSEAGNSRAPMPATLPTGENTITSDVSVTYEIR